MSSDLQVISVRLPIWQIEEIDYLVRIGLFPSRSEFIREAVRELLLRYKSSMKEKSRDALEGSSEKSGEPSSTPHY